MGVLKDTLLQTDNRPVVIQDCADLVDREVARKKGVTGMMIKGGYKAFKAIKPSIVTDAVDILLDDCHETDKRGAPGLPRVAKRPSTASLASQALERS